MPTRVSLLSLAAILYFLPLAEAADLAAFPEFQRCTAIDGRPLAADGAAEGKLFKFADGKVTLSAARGGYASFQLVVRADKPGKRTLTVKDAKGVEVELFREFYNLNSKDGLWYPDALVPAKSGAAFELPAPDNGIPEQKAQGFWVDVWVPAAAEKDASFSLAVDGEDGAAKLDVKLEIVNATYPAEDALTADHNCYGISFVGASHPKVVAQTQNFYISDPCFRLIQAYHRICYEHRGSFHQLGYNHSGGVTAAFAPELEGDGKDRHVKSWDNFDRHYGPLLDGTAFAGTRRGPHAIEGMYLPINPEWPARHFQWGTPDYDAEFINVVGELERHCKEKGWTHTGLEMFFNHKKRYKGFAWDGDETRFAEDDKYFHYFAALLKKAVPEGSPVKFRFRQDASWRMRGQFDTLKGEVTHWVLSGGICQLYPELFEQGPKRGDLVWTYGGTNGIYGPSFEIAELPLRAWLMGASGYTRWLSVADAARVPTKDFPGAECEIYSGEQFGIDGPIPSIRLKLERNVLQDLSLFQASVLKEKPATMRENVCALLGLKPAELFRPDSPILKDKPWEWSNASFSQDMLGAATFSKVPPTAGLSERLRELAFNTLIKTGILVVGVDPFEVKPAPGPLEGYKPVAAPAKPKRENVPDRAAFQAELKRIAALCQKELDAGECATLLPDNLIELLFKVDPRDEWAASDNYNVDLEKFDKLKKQLALIAHKEANYALDCNLWLVLKREPLTVHAAIRQIYGRSVFYNWGDLHSKPTPEQQRVLDKQETVFAENPNNRIAGVLAPLVKDGKVIGWVEVAAEYDAFANAEPRK